MAPNNFIPIWGNEKTMNLNSLVLTNIQSSPYFKVQLYELKTYHEVIDEIYYRVDHLEPWEKGSRKTAGQTGMCGGVRGVGAGGIVSSAFCLLFKLLTLKLTRKQLIGLCRHCDSPYIRGLGFMYIRFTQPPQDLWSWYEEYLNDEEEIDVKAGGGCVMTIGEMVRQFLTKLEWFSTLFPRIPVPIQKDIEMKLKQYAAQSHHEPDNTESQPARDDDVSFGEAERHSHLRRSPENLSKQRSESPYAKRRYDDYSQSLREERDRQRSSKSHEKSSNDRRRSRSRDRHRPSHDSHKHRHRTERSHHSRSSPQRSRHSKY